MDTPIMPTGEQLLETGKTIATNAVKTTVSDVATSVSDQVGITNETNTSNQNQNTNQGEPQKQGLEETQRTKELIQDFYSPSNDLVQTGVTQAQTDEQRLAAVRQKLHQELHNEVYFNQLLNTGTLKPNEERPAEKAERQQMEELQVKEEKRQNDLPLAVKMAQTHTEASPGIQG
jgi:hypothetical protein